jgi:hypothetical protein
MGSLPPTSDAPAWIRAFDHTIDYWAQVGRLAQAWPRALERYARPYLTPLSIAARRFQEVERDRIWQRSWPDTAAAYGGLLGLNILLMQRTLIGLQQAVDRFWKVEGQQARTAFGDSVGRLDPSALTEYLRRQVRLVEAVTQAYPQAVDAIAPEFGLHPERGDAVRVDETDRFILYRVNPTEANAPADDNRKPVLILPPFVLGANILAFLPGQQRSYVHAFANQGIPTYIRYLKKIDVTEALQTMTGDDDARDTRRFCQSLHQRHGRPVTLNGYCQGGFAALCNLLSGELDGLVDALVTCVAPMDGTRSPGLASFLRELPTAFNDLEYGTKTLPNGNRVADGTLMGWVYKLRSIAHESPMAALWRDLTLFAGQAQPSPAVGRTAAALTYWLTNERSDLPLDITRMSFASYTTPIAADGTLPVKLFDRPLSLRRLRERPLPWLICYGEKDDLVETETALAPLDFVDADVVAFPKGHVAIATSWSHPQSEYALHRRIGPEGRPGPVRFHLDLEAGGAR